MNAPAEPVLKTLKTLALEAATNKDLFQFIIDWWGRLLQTMHWSHLLKRLSDTELEHFSRSLPWDHPAAIDMDFQLYKRRMTGTHIVLIGPLPEPPPPPPPPPLRQSLIPFYDVLSLNSSMVVMAMSPGRMERCTFVVLIVLVNCLSQRNYPLMDVA